MRAEQRDGSGPRRVDVPSPRGAPRLERTKQVIPRGSTRWVLLHLIREARDPDWSPLAAAHRLVDYADADINLLRSARARLVSVSSPGSRPAGSQARALATINIAIAELSETDAQNH